MTDVWAKASLPSLSKHAHFRSNVLDKTLWSYLGYHTSWTPNERGIHPKACLGFSHVFLSVLFVVSYLVLVQFCSILVGPG